MFQHGVVVASFDGKEYGSDYLTVQKGDKVLVHAAWHKDGWDMAAQRCKTEPWFGWIPCAYWKVCDEILRLVLAQPEIVPFLAIPRMRLNRYGSYRLCLGHDLRNLLCVSIGLGSQVVTAVHHVEQTLKCRMLTALSQRFPSLCADVQRFGELARMWPFPEWHIIRVEMWWHFPEESRTAGRWNPGEWTCVATHYMNDLKDLPAVYKECFRKFGLVSVELGGVYKFERLSLSWWVWSYPEPYWQERDFL